MDSWAKGSWDCHFICICVLGSADALSLALEMGKQMKLTTCVNGFIDDKAGMPRKGQLGCQGFIVLDESLNQISAGTSAFMRVRDLAFKHVEALLTATTKNQPLPAICPGEFCCEIGESSEPAICVGSKDDQLMIAFLKSGKKVALPASKVRKMQEDDMEESGSESDEEGSDCMSDSCGTGGTCQPSGCQSGGCQKQNGGCGTGGYGPGGGSVPEAPVLLLKGVPSVKVASMDAEHDECVKALNVLTEQKTQDALRSVLNIVKAHFKHEEDLLDQNDWGGNVSDPFSAKGSHFKDHNRILEKISNELKVKRASVSTDFIKNVVQDFEEHAERYDSHYADHLEALGVQ
eukprot:gnl/MRDRNA2_/MRDRNA2_168825_c0_seq1.p1 gnl/MRDRNA2_/MRDRNA2_168825_c0~~gnl/MRDRNA2_/MRDRNA2_168825_c0_seq1.p1  ORF type:complete len:347 (-),score=73.82 gnl/MRDRNA2_/MRDRNA2_168825_c0_seq1:21-1061(-)